MGTFHNFNKRGKGKKKKKREGEKKVKKRRTVGNLFTFSAPVPPGKGKEIRKATHRANLKTR